MAETTIFGLTRAFYQQHIVDKHVSKQEKEEFSSKPKLNATSASACVHAMVEKAFSLQEAVGPLEALVKEQGEQIKDSERKYQALEAVFGNLEEAVGAAPRIKEHIQELEEAQGKLGQARQAETEGQNRPEELQKIDGELDALADRLKRARFVEEKVTPLFEELKRMEKESEEAKAQFKEQEEKLRAELDEAKKPSEADAQLQKLREEYERFKEEAGLEKKGLEQRIKEAGERLDEAGKAHELALEQLRQQKDKEIAALKEAQRLELEEKDRRIQELEAEKGPDFVQKNKAGLYDQIVALLNPVGENGLAAVQRLIDQKNTIVGFFDRLSVTLGLATQKEVTDGTIDRNAAGRNIEAIAAIVFKVFNKMYKGTVGVLPNLQTYEKNVRDETRMVNAHPGLVADKARLEGEVRGLQGELAGAKARSETLTGLASSGVRWTFTAITGVPRFMWEVIQG